MTIGRVSKYIGLSVLALMAITLLAVLLFRIPGNRRLQQSLAALRADHQPTTLAELVSPTVPGEGDARTHLEQAASAMYRIEGAVTKAEQPKRDDSTLSETFPLQAEILSGKRAALSDQQDTIALLYKAAECAVFTSGLTEANFIDGSFLDNIKLKRQAARTLSYHADVALADGDPQTALQDGIAILKLSRLFDADPTLINYLVAVALRGVAIDIANRALRGGPLAPELHRALDEELAKHDMVAAYRHALVTERAYGLHLFEDLASSPTGWLMFISDDTDDYLRYMQLGIRNADRPFSDIQARAELDDLINQSGRFTQLVAPAIGAASDANHRITAQLRCLRVLNALVQRPADAPPTADLNNLGLPADAITDPFNGQPLIIRPTPEGWIIYSVGRKLKDDGGEGLFNEEDNGRNIGLGTTSMQAAAEAAKKAEQDAIAAELRAIHDPPAEAPAEPPEAGSPAESVPDDGAAVHDAPAEAPTPDPGS